MGSKQSIVEKISSLDEHGASLLDIYANGFYIMEEKAQLQALKGVMVAINNLRIAAGKNQQNSKVAKDYQQVLVCLLSEFGCLVQDLGPLTDMIYCDLSLHVQETLLKLSAHPNNMVRLQTAWCLRNIAISLPQNLAPQIELYLDQLEKNILPITIHGYSCALAATIGASRHTKLGIPFSTGKYVFSIAEDFLRSSHLEETLSLEKTRAGWLLIGSITTLGTATLKSIIPRLLLLWKDSIMRPSTLLKEFSLLEKGKETYRWHVTIERIAGSLATMSSFLTWGENIVNDDVIHSILGPLECVVSIFTTSKKKFSTLIKNMDNLAMVSFQYLKLRFCEVIMQLPLRFLHQIGPKVLRFLDYEFTTPNNLQPIVTVNLLRHLSHKSVRVLLDQNYEDINKENHEESPEHTMSSLSSIEHDPTCLYNDILMHKHTHDHLNSNYLKNISYMSTTHAIPSPSPINTSLTDFSCLTIAHILPSLDDDTQMNFLDRLQIVLKQIKSSRLETVQMNVAALISASSRTFVENKNFKISNTLQVTMLKMIDDLIIHPNKFIRCASSEALCRLAQAVSNYKIVNTLLLDCLSKLSSATDCAAQAGLLAALGGLYRNVGTIGLFQNVTDSISLPCDLMLNSKSKSVQVWSLQTIMTIAESLGPTFRSQVDQVIDNLLKLSTLVSDTDYVLLRFIGRCLNGIITTVGPEIALATKETDTIRNNIDCINEVLKMSEHDEVKLEYISCIQQLHLFSPQNVGTSDIVPCIMKALSSSNHKFRRIALNCLRQFAQRENEMLLLDKQWRCHLETDDIVVKNKLAPYILETKSYGLIGSLFSMIDYEKDPRVINVIKKILDSSIQVVEIDHASAWLTICKVIITSANTSELALSNELTSMNSCNEAQNSSDEKECIEDPGEYFKPTEEKQVGRSPRWTTRIYAMSILRRLIEIYSTASEGFCNQINHYQIHSNRLSTRQINIKYNFLVGNLSDLIRMSFVAATSSIDDLRLEGLMMLRLIIDKFSHLEEREYPGHSILEQYQAQVSSALRPAFGPDVSPHITANACQVCSRWICSGVAQDLNDLRRIHHLMVSSINKIEKTINTNSKLYNECASNQERLAILTAWAEVYTAATTDEPQQYVKGSNVDCLKMVGALNQDQIKSNLLDLVRPQLGILIKYWLLALKDYAMLTLPRRYLSNFLLPHDGGTFYTQDTADIAKNQFKLIWSPLLRAATTWLCSNKFNIDNKQIICKNQSIDTNDTPSKPTETDCDYEAKALPIDHNMFAQKHLHLIFGISMEAFLNSRSSEPIKNINLCLSSLKLTLSQSYVQNILFSDEKLTLDLIYVMHRLLITKRDNLHHLKVLKIINIITSSLVIHITKVSSHNTYSTTVDMMIRVILEICICIFKENFGSFSLSRTQSGGGSIVPERSPSSNSLPAKLISSNNQIVNSIMASSSVIVDSTEESGLSRILCESKVDINSLDSILAIMSYIPKLHCHSCTKDDSSLPLFSSLFYILASMISRVSDLFKNDIVFSDIMKLKPLDQLIYFQKTLSSALRSQSDSQEKVIFIDQSERILLGFIATLLKMYETASKDLTETDFSLICKQRNQITILLVCLQNTLPYVPEIHMQTELIEKILDVYSKALSFCDYIIQSRAISILNVIYIDCEDHIVAKFINRLLMIKVRLIAEKCDSVISGKSSLKEKGLIDLIKNGLQSLQILIKIAQTSEKRTNIMTVYVRILSKIMVPSTSALEQKSQRLNPDQRELLSIAIDYIAVIGKIYPTEFKQVIEHGNGFRAILENAIKRKKEADSQIEQASQDKLQSPKTIDGHQINVASLGKNSKLHPGSIKLKTDFSNFYTTNNDNKSNE